MPSIQYICPSCGKDFIVTADYIIPGVYGFLGSTTIIDPDKPMNCNRCQEEMIAQLYLCMGEQNEKL